MNEKQWKQLDDEVVRLQARITELEQQLEQVGDGRLNAAVSSTAPAPEPRNYSTSWLEGVKARATEHPPDNGWVRLPLSDWQGVVDCFEMGERLYAEALARITELEKLLAIAYDFGESLRVERDRLREALTALADSAEWFMDSFSGSMAGSFAAAEDLSNAIAAARRALTVELGGAPE